MTAMSDFGPAAARMTALAENIRDEQLDGRTPCPDYTVGGLLAHVLGLSLAFRLAADKAGSPLQDQAPAPAELPPNWRAELPVRLTELAAAWQQESAWDGMTKVGGVDLPGAVAGQVGLNELVVHGWDLAKATGQPYDVDGVTAEASFTSLTVLVPQLPTDGGPFGPPVTVPDDAPVIERAIGLTGRDPHWTP